jgi:hypothetical protein
MRRFDSDLRLHSIIATGTTNFLQRLASQALGALLFFRVAWKFFMRFWPSLLALRRVRPRVLRLVPGHMFWLMGLLCNGVVHHRVFVGEF